ncbi:PKD domain-containing protein [Sediminibacterium sp.]|uniref:PKD domain-containing protein n=1 Tax=Sediminibacterium sp. TaxID=1917865 RepID=UPI0025D641B9|nr:PKD domain-containing protein [Sediminibacterium sp.]MBW0176921.1 gliding motility-associated C-terminal domain-containing protein [Sediminibacterium sp.]
MMPSVSIAGTLTVCQNATNPTLTITAVGGIAPYTITYNLNGVAQTAIATTTGAGTMTGTVTISAPTNVAGTFTYSLTSVVDANSLSETCTNSSVSSSATITVTALPTATITANTLTACVNSTAPVVTLTGLGGTAPFTFTYREITNGTPGSNQTIVSNLAGVASFSATVSSAATRNYELVSVQESSATACINAQNSSVTIVTNSNPDATGVNPFLPAVCLGTPNFSVTFSGVSGGPDQYRIIWDGTATAAGFTNDGFQTYNTGTNTITVTVPGTALANTTYNGTLRLQNSSTGCFLENSSSVTINPLPTATITRSAAAVCVNGTIPTVTITAAGATAPYSVTYRLLTNGVAGSNQVIATNGAGVATINVPVTTAAELTYELVSVQESSATACVNAQTSSTTVTVNPLPTATIGSSAAAVCVNGTAPTVTLTGIGGTAPYTFIYTLNSGSNQTITSTGNTAIITVPVTTAGTFTYQLVSVQESSATACVNAQTSSTTVTVNQLPTATTTATGPTTFCAGSSVTLNANTGTGLSYLWSNGSINPSVTNIVSSGTYTVTVTNTNNCSVTSAPTIVTVNALPTAAITASGPTTFCAGSSVTLNANTGTGLSYLWSNGSTNLSITNIASSGTYTVTVTNTNNCSVTSAPTIVTVNALPTSAITASGLTTFCAGSSVTLNANTGTGLSYLWSNGSTSPSVTNIASSGTYTVTVTNTNNCSVTSTPTIITVNALPTATITPSGPTTFCVGGSVNLTSSTGTSYLWSNASTNASITNITTSGTYSVTVRDANGCQNTSAPVTITVNANPTLNITNPAAICSPGTVDLTAAAITTGSTGGLNYTYWSNAAATTALTTPFAIGTAGTYYIRGTNTITNCAVIQPVVVSINPPAVLQINTPAAVCAPQTVDLTAAAITSGSAAGLSYTYFTNAAATTQLNNANAVNTSGVYYIKGTPVSGCSAVLPVTVTINPLPTLVVNNPAAVCSPQVINLTSANITAGSSAGLSFAYFSNASLTTPVANAQSVNSSGTFYIRATDATTGCVRALPVTVQINAAPQGVLATPAGNIICENSALTLNASGGNSYQWLLNQQPINGATAATYNATVAGNYAVRFISAQGCETVSANTISLELLSTPTVQFTLSNACAGVSTNFNNTSVTSASGGINWLWDFGDGSSSNQFSPSHIYSSAGTYSVRLTATSPVCSSFNETSEVTYRVQSALPAVRYKEVDVLKDIPATVTARAIGTSFLWQPAAGVSNIQIASPSIRVSTTTEYTVAITNDIGCTTTDTVLVKVIPGVDIYVPQGFTPNNDGQNDRLYPILVGMRQLNYFRVFNRWGHMIFTTKESSVQSGWNGQYLGVVQPIGTYTWIAEAIDLQGNVVRKTGTVLLLQ